MTCHCRVPGASRTWMRRSSASTRAGAPSRTAYSPLMTSLPGALDSTITSSSRRSRVLLDDHEFFSTITSTSRLSCVRLEARTAAEARADQAVDTGDVGERGLDVGARAGQADRLHLRAGIDREE